MGLNYKYFHAKLEIKQLTINVKHKIKQEKVSQTIAESLVVKIITGRRINLEIKVLKI
jgi:hypothetical protein